MKSIRTFSIGIVIIFFMANFLFQVFIAPILNYSEMLNTFLVSLVLAGLLFIFLEIMGNAVRKEIKGLEDCIQQFAKGNFLRGLKKNIKFKELKPMEGYIRQTEELMKSWIYHILCSEVSLGDLAEKLHDNSLLSLHSMKEISKCIDDVMVGSTNAANQSAENAAISEELLGSNTEIAAYSNEARNFAMESVNNIKRDSSVISDSLSCVDEIGTLMSESASSIATLKQLLDSISHMASSISAIAEQTNLLSLNASIEAARAGEAGRGFGVVANEIKKLSEQSAATVSQINKNISSIENSILQTIAIINKGEEKAVGIRSVSNEANKNLQNIYEKIEGMMDLISNISHNVIEQNNATEALAKNIEQIAGFTHETDKVTREIDKKVKVQVGYNEGNSKIAGNIMNITDRFKSFIEPIEKELDVELISACEKIASVINKDNISNALLDQISKASGITEIYITDKNGVISHSNNTAALGFAFSDQPGSQTYEFYKILNDPKLQVCQEARKRDLDGKYFKIVGVSRTDQRGIIQVGLSLDDIVNFKGVVF